MGAEFQQGKLYWNFKMAQLEVSATKGGAITYELDASTSNPDLMRFHDSGFN